MKREAKILLGKSLDSLILSIDRYNCPWDQGRVEAFLIMMDHAFEMLLKSAIIHRGGRIRKRREKLTIGFDACVREGLSGNVPSFLKEEQALTLQTINSLRDAVQHHYLDISEDHLYLHAQSGVTLFRDLLSVVFGIDLADKLPERVLPIATKVPTDLITLFEKEMDEVKKLLTPGKRRRVEALGRLRSLAIVENAVKGEKFQPDESDLRKLEKRIRKGEKSSTLFPSVSSITLVTEGQGPELRIRLSKKEGIPVQLVPEGTPGASVVAVKRVNELGFYSLNATELAKKVGLTLNKTVAVIHFLNLKGQDKYHKEFLMGKSKFDRYSPEAIEAVKTAVEDKGMTVIWATYSQRGKPKKSKTE
jgi:Domain of unknown function (DUF3644)